MERGHDGDAYLTTGAAARRLHLSTMTLRRALRRGEIAPTVRTPGSASPPWTATPARAPAAAGRPENGPRPC